MEALYLHMNWHYEYDKEGTWFDREDGESEYPLVTGDAHSLPNISRKSFEICSVEMVDGKARAEIYVDHRRIWVTEGARAHAHATYDYSAAGDSVHVSLDMVLSIVRK